MIDSLYIATNQITNLVNNINKKNYKQTVSEINQLLDQFKSDSEHHLLRALFSAVDFSSAVDSKTAKDLYKCQLLISEVNSRLSKPNFPSLICRAIDNPLNSQKCLRPTPQLLPQLSKLLKLSKVHEVVLGLCLIQSTNKETASFANQWVRQKLPDLLRSYVDGDSGGKEGGVFNDISMEILHLILSNLLNDKDKFGIGQDQLSAFLAALAKDFPKESVPVVLSAILENVDDFLSEKGSRSTLYIFNDVNYLSNIIEEMGPMSTQNIDDLNATLADFDSKLISSTVIAKCICMFMRLSSSSSSSAVEWNLNQFFTVIFEKTPSLDKLTIIKELDCKEFNATTKGALKTLHNCIIHCANTFPTEFFYSQWQHCEAQFSFLKSCFHNQEVICLSSWPHKVCDLSLLNIKVDDEQFENHISYWKNLDFIDALLRLTSDNASCGGLLCEIGDLFDIPLSKFPHILVCALMQSTVVNEFKSRLFMKLFTYFITNNTVPASFFSISWKNADCKPLILSALFEYYKESENNLKNLSCVSRIAEIISDIKAVQYILPNSSNVWYPNIFRANSTHFRYEAVHFALDIVIYCTRKNSEFLTQWVGELLLKESGQVQNFKALVTYVHVRYPKVIDNEDSKFFVPRELILDAHCLYDFLRHLDQIAKIQFQSDVIIKTEMHAISHMMKKLSTIIAQTVAASTGVTVGGNRQTVTGTTPTVSRNKLDPTRSAFVPQSKMQRGEVMGDVMSHEGGGSSTITSITSTSKYVTQVRPYPDPGDDKIQAQQAAEQEIDKNLKQLFEGELSVQTMVELYCTPGKSKREHVCSLVKVLMEELQYIDQYPDKQGRIYADLFIHVLNLDNNLITKTEIAKLYDTLLLMQSSLNNSNSNGREIVERIINCVNQSKKPETQETQPSLSNVVAPNNGGNAESPPESVTEKVFFIINNVSKMNVQEKASLLSEVVTQEYTVWFAQYLVMKRVTTEANFHDLFIQLIDCMSDQLTGLKDKVLYESYRNIKMLLLNMKSDLSDFNDRQLLKNLGKFLGMITLAKNKPILHDDMNLKDLLHEAYTKGHIELHYVVPFVTKTLEAAKDSIVFRPPCPWTTAILKVLKELHEVESVKLNLKFEVEILCRNLKLDFSKLTAAFFLNDRSIQIETHLCRLANNIQSSSSTGPDMLHNDSLSMQNTFDNHQTRPIGNNTISQQRSQHNLDTLDANRGSSIVRPNMTYQQQQQQQQQQGSNIGPVQAPSSSVVAMQNYQSMRVSTNQDVSQYYAGVAVTGSSSGQNQYNSGQQQGVGSSASAVVPSSSMVGGMDHSHSSLIRSLSTNCRNGPVTDSITADIPYDELNTNNIINYLSIDDIPAPILNQIPNLKNQLTATMERIVMDLISPLYDRCAKITIGTVDQLVVKDFGMDCDINIIKQYAFGMCRNLTAGLCLVTAREIVGVNLNTAVKQTILGEYRHVNIQDKEQVDNFANKIVSTNNEICVAYLQKVVSEKAIGELEKKLNNIIVADVQKRNQPKPSAQELQVYECFSRNIPGFPTMPNALLAASAVANNNTNTTNNIPSTWNNSMMHQRAQLAATRQQQQQQQQFIIGGGGGSGAGVTSDSNNMSENPISRMISEIERQMNFISSIARNDNIIRSLRQIVDIACLALHNNDPQLIHRLMRETVSSFMTMYHSQILRDCAQGLEIMERLKEAHMYSLRIMQPYEETSVFMSVNKQVTLAWTNMEEPKQIRQNGPGKWNGEAFSELLKTHVISLPSMDAFLANKILDHNISALIFVLDLLKYFVTGDKREFTVLNEFDLSQTIDAIGQVQGKVPPDVGKLLSINMAKINQLLDLGTLSDKTVHSHHHGHHNYQQQHHHLYTGISLSREFDDPPTMPERSEIVIRKWMEHYCSKYQRDQSQIQSIVNSMATQYQLIQSEESLVRFLRLATVYVVERAHKHLKQDIVAGVAGSGSSGSNGSHRSASYTEIDAYAMLVCTLVLRSGISKNEVNNKSALLNKALGIIAGTLLQEHEVRRDWFHPMSFHRILIMLFNELQQAMEEDSSQYELQLSVLTAFTHTLHVIRPKCAPSFAFSWLELVSHRSFITQMLYQSPTHVTHTDITHAMYIQLIVDLFTFLRPYLENLHVPRPIQLMYKATVSLTCLLMHDFPDILINYHSLLCTILPVNCYQLRNIVLCTSPKNIKLPDVTRPLHVDQLSHIEDPPGHCLYAGNRIKPLELRQELDSYLATRQPVKFLSELVNGLKKDNTLDAPQSSSLGSNITILGPKEMSALINVPEENITRSAYHFKSNGVVHYDVELMNNVIIYLCVTATRVLRDKNIPLNINTIAHTAQMDIIQSLVLNLDNEGRFLLLNCMANQLRYPNSHSYYFIYTFLYLFAEQPQESVKEQITRVILERIIVNRPHPWGLLHLMNELFKNPLFWSHKFLHCSEEVMKILDSVVKGCRGTVPPLAIVDPARMIPIDDMTNNSAGVTSES